MLKSLYTYKGGHARTLPFEVNDSFLEIGISKDPSWVHVINENGCLGYVPKNYVAVDQVPPSQMVELIDKCIEGMHKKASENEGLYSRVEHEALCVLVEQRDTWNKKIPPSMRPGKRPAPPPPKLPALNGDEKRMSRDESLPSLPSLSPTHSPSTIIGSLRHNQAESVKKKEPESETVTSFIVRGESLERDGVDPLKSAVRSEDTSSEEELPFGPMDPQTLLKVIPSGYYRRLVDSVRSNTNVSFSASHQVVTLVLQSLGATFKSLNPLVNEILKQEESSGDSPNRTGGWGDTVDGRRLLEVLEKLRQCKDDSQQRSWALHEDEHTIKQMLEDFLDIITNGDGEVCSHIISLDDHRPVLNLVQYYQMETRWPLRKLLLQAFTAICHLDRQSVTYLSSSVLPLELTREILDSKTPLMKMQYVVLVLGMILSLGDTLPVIHFSTMNEAFIEKVFDSIEVFSDDPENEMLGELFLHLLLAFNLQYHTFTPSRRSSPAENIVIKVLSQQMHHKHFLEKFLLLFNREEDPVAMLDHSPAAPNSVLCFACDLFSSESTAQLLYTNDEKVVCDIVLRQITDLSPEDKRRREYLFVLNGIVKFGRWQEHRHRQEEFSSRLASILAKEDLSTDRQLIESVLKSIL